MSKPEHDPELVRSVEDAILNVAARPPGLRGPFILDDDWLRASAEAIRARRRTDQFAIPPSPKRRRTMNSKLTKAQHRALEAVAAGTVVRIYRGEGNVLKGPPGISSRTLWQLAENGWMRDTGKSARAPQVLTDAGRLALSKAHPNG